MFLRYARRRRPATERTNERKTSVVVFSLVLAIVAVVEKSSLSFPTARSSSCSCHFLFFSANFNPFEAEGPGNVESVLGDRGNHRDGRRCVARPLFNRYIASSAAPNSRPRRRSDSRSPPSVVVSPRESVRPKFFFAKSRRDPIVNSRRFFSRARSVCGVRARAKVRTKIRRIKLLTGNRIHDRRRFFEG